MLRTAACSLAAAVLVSVFAACGGGGDSKTATREAPPAGKTPAAVVTGDGTIDQILDAALRSDDIALAGLTGYQKVPCKIGTVEEIGEAPACRDNEKDGDSVEVLASSACTNGWIRPEQVPDAYRFNLASDKPSLVEVIKPRLAPTTYGGGFGATAAIVLKARTSADGQPGGVALHLTAGRISWLQSSCQNLSELTTPDRVESIIYDPANPAASASATATAVVPADGAPPPADASPVVEDTPVP